MTKYKLVPQDAEFFVEFVREWQHFKHMGVLWKIGFWEQLMAAVPEVEPLTDEEIVEMVTSGEYNVVTNDWASHIEFARAIERRVLEGK